MCVLVRVNALEKAPICTADKLSCRKQMSNVPVHVNVVHVNVWERPTFALEISFHVESGSDYRRPIAIS